MTALTRIRFGVTLAACCLAGSAAADTTTDGLWRGSGGAALSYTSGNSNDRGLALNLDLARATERDKVSLGGHLTCSRSKADGATSTTSNKWDAFGRYDHNLGPLLFAYGRLGLEADHLVHLSRRTSLDAGLGYKLVDSSALTFSVFGGAGYSNDAYSELQTIQGRTDDRFSRASVSLAEESLHRFSPAVEFKQRLEVNPAVSGDKTTLGKFSAGLSVAMNSTLSLTVNVNDTYNNRPPDGARRNDLGVFTGINVKIGPH